MVSPLATIWALKRHLQSLLTGGTTEVDRWLIGMMTCDAGLFGLVFMWWLGSRGRSGLGLRRGRGLHGAYMIRRVSVLSWAAVSGISLAKAHFACLSGSTLRNFL